MARPPRDPWPNHYVGDLARNKQGTYDVVSPTYCPNWHTREEGDGFRVSCPPCTCGNRHKAWRCWCGSTFYAPKLGPRCRIIDASEGVVPPTGD